MAPGADPFPEIPVQSIADRPSGAIERAPSLHDWDARTIGEVSEILDHLRAPVNSNERSRRPGVVPYYGANGQQGWIDRPLFDEPLILLAEDGGNFDEYAHRPIAYRITGPSWVNNHAHILRARSGVNQSFLFHALEHRDIRRYISGGTRTKLTQTELRAVQIIMPPPREQRRIAEILDTIDKAINCTTQFIAKLKQIKEGLLHELLTRGIDDNGELRDPQLHPEQFEASRLGPIPRDWTVERLGAVATKIQDGTHFSPQSSDGPYRYVTSKNVRFGFLDLSDCEWISESEHRTIFARCDVRAGDVLLTKDGANTGNAALNTLTEQFSLLSSVALVRLNAKRDSPALLLQYLLSPVGQRRIKDAVSGLAITRLTLRTINQFLVPRPPHDEQLRIAEPLAALDDRLQQELLHMRKLQGVRDGLAQDLLTGRIRLTDGSIGDPA